MVVEREVGTHSNGTAEVFLGCAPNNQGLNSPILRSNHLSLWVTLIKLGWG
jgi:hypothetical protein